jgi:hypothetical protein
VALTWLFRFSVSGALGGYPPAASVPMAGWKVLVVVALALAVIQLPRTHRLEFDIGSSVGTDQ